MLYTQKIPSFRVKEAYGLNSHEPQELLDELSPDNVFPYELWQKAYCSYWKYPTAECSRLYKVENPPFPKILQLPEKHFPTGTYAKLMVDFFFEMARRISVKDLESGFDYIVETTYDSKTAISDPDRSYLFYHLQLVEKNIATVTRVEGTKKIDLRLSYPDVLLTMFPDTIAVNNISAIYYWSVVRGYPFVKEVKGITQKHVDLVTGDAARGTPPVLETPSAPDEPAVEFSLQKEGNSIRVPAALWEGKSDTAIREAMSTEFDDSVIAHVLYSWCKVQKTRIGSLLWKKKHPEDKKPTDDKSFRNLANKFLQKAESLTIVKA